MEVKRKEGSDGKTMRESRIRNHATIVARTNYVVRQAM